MSDCYLPTSGAKCAIYALSLAPFYFAPHFFSSFFTVERGVGGPGFEATQLATRGLLGYRIRAIHKYYLSHYRALLS